MRTGFLGNVVVVGLLLVLLGVQQLSVAEGPREPTVDDQYRDANGKTADTELPRLNAPQSTLAPPNAAAGKGSAAAYLGVTFAGDERMAIVRSVAPGSPAEQAGLQPNDLIETLQGRRIRKNQEVLDIVAKMRPGDVLDIGFTRRMNIRTQAPLASAPAATPHSVGYSPDSPASTFAAPEDPQSAAEAMPQPKPKRNYLVPQTRNDSSSDQRRNDNRKSNQSDENRRLFGRGLRLR